MKVVIDIDGTICDERPTFEKSLADKKDGVVESINYLYEKGVFIILYTARGWAEYQMTVKYLNNLGIKYDILICGKPIYDYWIDDRAIEFTSWKDVMRRLEAKLD